MTAKSGTASRLPTVIMAIAFVTLVAVAGCSAAPSSPTPSSSAGRPALDHPATPSFIGDCCAPPTRQPYALVTARPGGPAADVAKPSQSYRPTAEPTAADALAQDGSGYVSGTVAAGETTTIPIDFEGSSWGTLVVYAKSPELIVRFGGKTLQGSSATMLGPTGVAWSVTSDSPVNGVLTIKNSSKSPLDFVSYLMITTRRHLSIEPSARNPRMGQQFSFAIGLTEATDSDELTVTVTDANGLTVPASVTRAGPGRWSGWATLPAIGTYLIRASTTGSRMRVATSEVDAIAGNVTASATFGEEAVDSDRDGLIDQLVLTPTITVPTAGKYGVNADLYDRSGRRVTNDGTGEITLVAGAQPVPLEFGGEFIYKSGLWGPYTLVVTVLRYEPTTTIELDIARLGDTAAYDYMQFQHDRVAVGVKSLADKAVDTNGDGLYEELDLTGTVTVEEPGLYMINGSIYADKPWDYIEFASTKVQLVAGPNDFTLVFKGSDFAKAGRDGPYAVPSLLCYLDGTGAAAPSSLLNYQTKPYSAAKFSR